MTSAPAETGAMSTHGNRHGKRHPDKVQFGGLVSPEFKAIAMLTARELNLVSLTEMMSKGIADLATNAGIIRNGSVASQYREEVSALADVIRTSLSNKRKGTCK